MKNTAGKKFARCIHPQACWGEKDQCWGWGAGTATSNHHQAPTLACGFPSALPACAGGWGSGSSPPDSGWKSGGALFRPSVPRAPAAPSQVVGGLSGLPLQTPLSHKTHETGVLWRKVWRLRRCTLLFIFVWIGIKKFVWIVHTMSCISVRLFFFFLSTVCPTP